MAASMGRVKMCGLGCGHDIHGVEMVRSFQV
jgi:hypothetical protein